ncbi:MULTISPECIES: TetR/AcrR family transcriptional regulator [Prauserella salsuginis group]|uniref:AcrR family transcriptional regulator n=2 Tax=Prauserella salsuginis group TaxID=2893672 RepID=A0A839XPG0_9PSEU|nr:MULTISPECIES: TetR/AcrR family transcriptional regulator [Prauserella salsuginis group]MBB3663789.1 AcrR family transcriptional regulator [Prauserella sediminis]MCR3722432.1 transcriptional regulator, TetR family [Prauserella flava]MCR3736874.1 transcriptional regulator, TetR family [Prauserella salsuginis]
MARGTPVADLTRSIYLLWGHHPKPGRSGLTVPAIVEAGTELADAHGLAAVSMRKVAEHLGVGAMSLYGYVPGKEDLTALMTDAAYGELYDDVTAPTEAGNWREAMRFVARRNWELYERHPWLLEVRSPRPDLGPGVVGKYEAELRPLDGIGLSDVEMDSVLALILGHVADSARTHAQHVRENTGMTDVEWWDTVSPVLDQVMRGENLPVSGRVGATVGTEFQAATDPEHNFTFGLEVILDGVQARLD